MAFVLTQLRDDRDSQARRNGPNDRSGWVFVNRDGSLISEDWPRRVLAKAWERAGLPCDTPCDLRHTFATLHLAKGHPITYVSAQLGHSNPATTLK